MKKTGRWSLRALAAGTTAVALTAALTTQAGAATTWTIFQTNTFAADSHVYDVTVAPTGSTWGVGGTATAEGVRGGPLVQHWVDGKFRTVTLPSAWTAHFMAVDASSSKNVWAFGADMSGSVAAHWNGSVWRGFRLPYDYFGEGDLQTYSASNTWLVGYFGTAMHWNGTSWREMSLPVSGRAIDGRSPTQTWVVGGAVQPAAARWDGTKWIKVPVPTVALPTENAEAHFDDVAVVSNNDVWAVGTISWSDDPDSQQINQERPILAHYVNGKWAMWTNSTVGGHKKVVADGQGGIHILQGNAKGSIGVDNASILHGRNGTWTRTSVPRPAGLTSRSYSLERNPVTGTLWSTGNLIDKSDENGWTYNSAYWRRLAG